MQPQKLAELLAIPKLPIYLESVDKELLAVTTSNSPILSEQTAGLIKAGGKRLRPILVIAAVASGNGKIDKEVISAAAAIELVHLASLVHDDVIDNAKTRRGQPTINSQVGEEVAILAGDYLLALAVRQAAALSQDIAYIVADTIATMAEGQSRGLADRYNAEHSINSYLEASRRKTAALIAAALQAGALCTSLPKHQVEALARYGEAFGMAYQLIDDLLDSELPEQLLRGGSSEKALLEIRDYNRSASDSLKEFKGNKTAAGLQKLPDVYLNSSTPKML